MMLLTPVHNHYTGSRIMAFFLAFRGSEFSSAISLVPNYVL